MPLFYNPITQVRDDDDDQPVSGALAYFYTTGTLTPADVYEDNALTTEHEQPVVALANGTFPAIYLDPAITYRVRITSPSGTVIRDNDPITGGASIGTDDIADNAVTTDKLADDAVTASKIADQAVSNAQLVDMPASTIKANATASTAAAQDISPRALNKLLDRVGTIAAVGYVASNTTLALVCNGQAVSRATYADLFVRIGTAWGAGDGSTTFNVPDFRNRVLRMAVGSLTGLNAVGGHAVGTYQEDTLQDHFHTANVDTGGAGADNDGRFSSYGGNATSGATASTLGVSATPAPGRSDAVRISEETRMKNAAVDFVIYW